MDRDPLEAIFKHVNTATKKELRHQNHAVYIKDVLSGHKQFQTLTFVC